jgi:hypothetical protein
MTINNSIADTDLLEDALSLFRPFIYAMISCFIILFTELFIQIKFECKISYATKKILFIRELFINKRNDRQIIVGLVKKFPLNHM